jgi:hypothetical protein
MSDSAKQYDPPAAREIQADGEPTETAAIVSTDA